MESTDKIFTNNMERLTNNMDKLTDFISDAFLFLRQITTYHDDNSAVYAFTKA